MTALDGLPLLLTVEETAGILRVGRSAAYQAVRSGQIPSIRVGRTLRVPRHALEQLLAPTRDNGHAGNVAEVEVRAVELRDCAAS